jgi:hypothetical protein
MSAVVVRARPVELSDDRRMAGRVRRLARTAVVALGIIWWLAVSTLEAPPLVGVSLLLGWASMPAILLLSLRRPRLRYALVVPSSLVGIPLLGISGLFLPSSAVAAVGWLLLTAGILLGSAMGLWFWYRVLPVPRAMDDPFSAGRIALIGVHIALIVVGAALASTGLLR